MPKPFRPVRGRAVGNSISWQASDEIRHQVTKTHRLVYLDAVMGSTIGSQWQDAVDAVRRPDGPTSCWSSSAPTMPVATTA